MPLEHVFTGYALAIEPLPIFGDMPPGKRLIIIDTNTGENWSYPMDDQQAKIIGGKLLGLGEVQTATPADVSKMNGKGRH